MMQEYQAKCLMSVGCIIMLCLIVMNAYPLGRATWTCEKGLVYDYVMASFSINIVVHLIPYGIVTIFIFLSGKWKNALYGVCLTILIFVMCWNGYFINYFFDENTKLYSCWYAILLQAKTIATILIISFVGHFVVFFGTVGLIIREKWYNFS